MSKVKFGLSNVHIALRTETGGKATYGSPTAYTGAVNLTLSRNTNQNTTYADNIPYFSTNSKGVMTGELELMDVPRAMALAILGYVENSAGGILETNKAVTPAFALLFQVETDDKARKIALYNVTAAESDSEESTTEDSVSPTTTKLTLTISGETDSDGNVFYRNIAESGDANYATFFTTVALPSEKTSG